MSIRALAATAVALTLTATPACADSTAGLESTDTLTVLTMNAHGSTDRFGGGNRGRTAATSRDVSALVRKYRPDAIAMQELCGTQYAALRKVLKGYSAIAGFARRSGGCNSTPVGNRFGNALLLRGALAWHKSTSLPWGKAANGTTGRENRTLACGRTKNSTTLFCAAHLSPVEPDRSIQAQRVLTLVKAWARSSKATGWVLAGDLNMRSAAAGRIFGPAAGSSIDWVAGTAPRLVAAHAIGSSDHPAVVVATKERAS